MKIDIINNSKFTLPKYKTDGSAGLDLQADIDQPLLIEPLQRVLVPTGLFISIPGGFEAQIRARSGLALNHGITLANGIGTIDSDYRGEIKVILVNLSDKGYVINRGDRIAQMVFIKYQKVEFNLVDNLDKTDRGEGGFGHSGY
ncbi:MAG: dUTP diphosphatase [Tissierellaceae bacterium]